MERPQKEIRKPELLYIVGCEGKNQEKKYFERVQYIINSIPSRTWNVLFDFAEPFGGNPRCVVERTINKSIGKSKKMAIFDYDGKQKEYEEALELADANIKKEANVAKIVNQIELNDIITAMKRANKITQDNVKRVQHHTPNARIAYYDNPDTQIHIALKTIFNKTGIKINCR